MIIYWIYLSKFAYDQNLRITLAKKAAAKTKMTPLMQQYFEVKGKYANSILLFRVGDFYETFADDAIKASDILGIVLTKRNNGGSDVPLAGFPYHSLDVYLPKLVRAGYRVAICEQLEKPSKEKKIVKRGVTDLVTPGVTTHDNILDHKSNNYLSSIHIQKDDILGISFLDISTGDFLVSEGNISGITKLLQGFNPSEIIYAKDQKEKMESLISDEYYKYALDEWIFTEDYCREKLMGQFDVASLKGFGIDNLPKAQVAAGSILHYLETTENKKIQHVNKIARIPLDDYVWLDRFTIRNLELVRSNHPGGTSLVEILDQTVSPLGARLLKKWIILPLVNEAAIKKRLSKVEFFIGADDKIEELDVLIRRIGDLERFISKAAIGKINPREIKYIERALEALEPIRDILRESTNTDLELLAGGIQLCEKLKQKITIEIVDDPPALLSKGGVFKEGFHDQYDEYKSLIRNSKEILLDIQNREAEATGITNLKIGFNNVFGYYLEVTNKYKNQGLIPDHWVRKQTLTGSERYISDELKQLETKILGAEDKLKEIEEKLYDQMVLAIQEYIKPIQADAGIIAKLDCILSMAKVAAKNNYVKPEVSDSDIIDIKDGRHPVIEINLPLGEAYIPNDIYLDQSEQQIIMITGPNMSGKSAVLRQTALICLMAQMGSYVPASKAELGILHKIFTRVGASDNISSGESTFMVEMNETASIMNNVCDKSLILLDEIGRGTSTYDGISIAWSLAEFLHESLAKPKTLFATHYHELNELSSSFERIKNFNVSTKELKDKVIFLRKLKAGGSHHSFGIHVAKMAGMPNKIVERANEILLILEQKSVDSSKVDKAKLSEIKKPDPKYQLNFFESTDPEKEQIIDRIHESDLNSMTPLQCMNLLNDLKALLNKA